jgi:DNA-binding MarR family transcriptional regulator
MNLEQEIKMQRFTNEFQRAYLNVIFTANFLEARTHQQLKQFNLTPPQFNVLRILRGQKGQPMSALAIQERMIHRTSNVTRILEKLVEKKLVTRENKPDNRRMIDVLITDKGLELLNEASVLVDNLVGIIESAMSEDQARQLGDWMDAVRNIEAE